MKKHVGVLAIAALLVGVAVTGTAIASVKPAVSIQAPANGTYSLVDTSDSRIKTIKASPEFKTIFGDKVLEAETAAIINVNGKTLLMATFKQGNTIVSVQKDTNGNTLSFVTGVIEGKTLQMKDSISGKTLTEDLTNTHHGDLSASANRTITPESRYDRCYWSCVVGCLIEDPGPWCGLECMLQCV